MDGLGPISVKKYSEFRVKIVHVAVVRVAFCSAGAIVLKKSVRNVVERCRV